LGRKKQRTGYRWEIHSSLQIFQNRYQVIPEYEKANSTSLVIIFSGVPGLYKFICPG
jgi:hypothetical protein